MNQKKQLILARLRDGPMDGMHLWINELELESGEVLLADARYQLTAYIQEINEAWFVFDRGNTQVCQASHCEELHTNRLNPPKREGA